MFFAGGTRIDLRTADLYSVLYSQEKLNSQDYDAMPPVTSDIDIQYSQDMASGEAKVDHSDQAIYLDPSLRNQWDEIRDLTGYGIRHLRWHPNHGLAGRTERFDTRSFSDESMRDYRVEIHGEEVDADPEEAARMLYQGAADDFGFMLQTDFRVPDLVLEESVMDSGDPVGYSIDHEADLIALNTEMLADMNPDLLEEDFRYMLKRYHDLSLEETVRKEVVPYIEGLRDEAEMQVETVIFDDLEEGVGSYDPEMDVMRVDYSKLREFDPVTGSFEPGEGLTGSGILVHEGTHDLDFTSNQSSLEYLKRISDADIDDPRNAVLEAPTTFEVLMAGQEVRTQVLEAFENPGENLKFFARYPPESDGSISDSINDPYNMGLFTALSIHTEMMERHGVEKGTRYTRDVLYGNNWDLDDMMEVMETTYGMRDVANVPYHIREVGEILDEGVDAAAEEAERLSDVETEEEALRARILITEFEDRQGFGNAPDALDELDEEAVDILPSRHF